VDGVRWPARKRRISTYYRGLPHVDLPRRSPRCLGRFGRS
jgi:hypothetical protein